ncbi:MAG: hypothetical protein P8I91_08215 [Phycisphaerales bacterium]|nr:hypothetical protein [Phycisphaerales bacterium]
MNDMLNLLLCAVLSTFAAPHDEVQAFQLAGVEPIVAPSDFRLFVSDLQLGLDERDAADLLLDDYAASMRTVLSDLRAHQAADRDRLEAALSGKIRLDAHTIREIRIALLTIVADACQLADGHISEMIEWAVLLSPADASTISQATGRFERRVFLVGGNREGLVDITILAEEASKEELSAADSDTIDMTLGSYNKSIAAIARSDAVHVRDARIQDGIAALRSQNDARRSLQQDLAMQWIMRMELQDAAVSGIAKILDDEATAAWQARANQSLFPSVCGRLDADRAHRWAQANVSNTVSAVGQKCIDTSMPRLLSLRAEAMTLLREGRSLGVDLDHEAASLVEPAYELRMKYLRNSGERSVLEQEMLDCVLRPLTDGQRAAVRRLIMTGE